MVSPPPSPSGFYPLRHVSEERLLMPFQYPVAPLPPAAEAHHPSRWQNARWKLFLKSTQKRSSLSASFPPPAPPPGHRRPVGLLRSKRGRVVTVRFSPRNPIQSIGSRRRRRRARGVLFYPAVIIIPTHKTVPSSKLATRFWSEKWCPGGFCRGFI